MLPSTSFLRSVFVEKTNIWDACIMAFTSNHNVLSHSPIVLIYRQGESVISKTLIYSEPRTGVWGIKPICTNPQCQSQAGDVFSKTHKVTNSLTHARASWSCKRCNRKTEIFNRPLWIEEVPNHRNFFFYDYPFEGRVETLARNMKWMAI